MDKSSEGLLAILLVGCLAWKPMLPILVLVGTGFVLWNRGRNRLTKNNKVDTQFPEFKSEEVKQ